MGQRGLIWGLRGLIWGLRGAWGGADGRTDRRLEIHPCVLQDTGPLGPLPCSYSTSSAGHRVPLTMCDP